MNSTFSAWPKTPLSLMCEVGGRTREKRDREMGGLYERERDNPECTFLKLGWNCAKWYCHVYRAQLIPRSVQLAPSNDDFRGA
ncbi:hypothetical protein TNCV_746251 [Trichonephila clavipes]|nr:hypothetical protein TNCV_746251 [Trichonephila clavipes]